MFSSETSMISNEGDLLISLSSQPPTTTKCTVSSEGGSLALVMLLNVCNSPFNLHSKNTSSVAASSPLPHEVSNAANKKTTNLNALPINFIINVLIHNSCQI